jgi:iron(III) transport system permease protein
MKLERPHILKTEAKQIGSCNTARGVWALLARPGLKHANKNAVPPGANVRTACQDPLITGGKNGLFKKGCLVPAALGLFLLLAAAPLLSLALNVLSESGTAAGFLLNSRRMNVMLRTVSFAGAVALISSVAGLYLAICVSMYKKLLFPFFAAMVVFISVPPYIHAFCWMELGFSFFHKLLSGFGISLFVQSVYFIPFCALLFYASILTIDEAYFNEGRLNSTETKTILITIKELSAAPFVLVFLFIFLFCMNDYTIPSIFAFNTYPIEIMTVFASTTGLLKASLAALPSTLISVALVFTLYRCFKAYFVQHEVDFKAALLNPKITLKSYGALIPFMLLFIIQTVIPCVFLLFDVQSLKNLVPSVRNHIGDILFTLMTSFTAGVVSVLAASFLAFAGILQRRLQMLTLNGSILLLGIPATFCGIAMVSLYNCFIPEFLYYSPWMTVHALVFRFLPIAFFILHAHFSRYTDDYIGAALLDTGSFFPVFRHVILPGSWNTLAGSWLVLFVLGIGELSASIMVIPPGKSTLSITIYNYLHYGSSGSVKGLCTFVFISCLAGALLMLRVYGKVTGRRVL